MQLAADNTVAKVDSKVKPVKPEPLQIGDEILIYRPLSTTKEAKFDWIDGFTVVDYNDFTARVKNVKTGTLDWVHRRHIRKVQKRPPHLDDDEDDDDSAVIDEVKTSKKMKVEPSSTGGGETKSAPAVKSDEKVDEKTSELQSKPKRTRSKIKVPPTAASSRSRRTLKQVDRLDVSKKGQSYANVVRGQTLQRK